MELTQNSCKINLTTCKTKEEENSTILNNLNDLAITIRRSERYTILNTSYFSQVDTSDFNNCEIIDSVLYRIALFYYDISNNKEVTDNEYLKKEIDFILENNHCVYISIIIKYILEVINKDIVVNFNQGYYRFKNNPFAKFIFGDEAIGFHAWCDIDGAILDSTFIPQQQSSYTDSFDITHFFGNQPSDITFVGYRENNDIALEYLKDLLSVNGSTFKEWIWRYLKLFRIVK